MSLYSQLKSDKQYLVLRDTTLLKDFFPEVENFRKTLKALEDQERVGLVLRLPPATVLRPPPDVKGATSGEAGYGADMAGAHVPTVADIEPVFGILADMAAGKGHRGAGQGGAGDRGGHGRGKGARGCGG